jgi:hypothetical protein
MGLFPSKDGINFHEYQFKKKNKVFVNYIFKLM